MQIVINLLRGVAVGIANIIPGVSGGTMALILGIYQRLITAIGNLGPSTVKSVFKGRATFVEEMKRVDALFLGTLGVGAVATVVGIASIMARLLKDFHDPTYGFFFGLVLASVVVPYRMIKKFGLGSAVACALAVCAVLGLSMAVTGDQSLHKARSKRCGKIVKTLAKDAKKAGTTPAAPPADCAQVLAQKGAQPSLGASRLLLFFIAGLIAISAMILPGISGSFMLLLMGIYFEVLACINQVRVGLTTRQFGDVVEPGLLLGAMALGCVVGLLLFTRLLKFLLERFHDPTLASLTGLIIGSLYAIWPFRSWKWDLPNAEALRQKVFLDNVLPRELGSNELLTLATAVVGVALVVGFIVLEKKFNKGGTAA